MSLDKILFMAVVVEYLVEVFKLIYDHTQHKLNWDMAVAIIVGVAVCVSFKIDVFKLYEMSSIWEPLGSIFTGLLFCRGANLFHELIKLVEKKAAT